MGAQPIRPTIVTMAFLTALRAWCSEHKKLVASIAAAIVQVVPDTSWLDHDTKLRIMEALLVYVGAQGIADHGKEAAKVNAAAAAAADQRAGLTSGMLASPPAK